MKVLSYCYLIAIAGLLSSSHVHAAGPLLCRCEEDSGVVQAIPQPALNWNFGCDEGAELDCGPMRSLQQCENACGINYGGWFSVGITTNNWGNTTLLGNSQLPFNNDPHLNLNQAWFWIERKADTDGSGWDWGFHADLIAGVDGPDTEAFGGPGWDSTWQWGNGEYGAAVPQLYAELAYDDLSVICGRFYTILGYEDVPSPYNFFYSHDYTMAYGEPFTHTGLLAEYTLTDQITLHGGWTNGWDQGFQFGANGSSTFLGGINYTSEDERTSFTWTVIAGYWGRAAVVHSGGVGGGPTTMTDGNIYDQSFVWQQMIADRWTYVFQTDLGINSQTTQVQGVNQTQWYSVVQYLFYNFNCCWATGLRAEWFSDPQGVRVDRANLNVTNLQGQTIPGPNRANYFEITAGVNWRPSNNFRLRPEIRYDWAGGMGTGEPRFDPVGTAYRQADLWTLGIDAIWLF